MARSLWIAGLTPACLLFLARGASVVVPVGFSILSFTHGLPFCLLPSIVRDAKESSLVHARQVL